MYSKGVTTREIADGRGKVLRWVMDKYGHENCAHIITYGYCFLNFLYLCKC